ncbi:cytochrome c-type biogenesis protein [Candidatus Colwellia aromaticivorans]|uniref:cytochrome c-type biogenesis protein n=1 Tax=Candidatus Colwellia aromaticivorans TaxID=2267621 RepID=UPI001FE31C56|nr:cytochrome c-type biogenesis protein [Candidatus Colwellia aromaticivorans]
MLNKILLIVVLTVTALMLTSTANASPVETFEFRDEVTKVRFQALSKELRCPKCQNQNLADSNSPIAEDLRRELYELLQQGKADSEIVNFMVSRYGEFVLYRPRVSSITYILWFGPALLILIGVIVVIVILRKKPAVKADLALSSQQQDKLQQLLETNKEHASQNLNTDRKDKE